MPYKILEHTADWAVNFSGNNISQIIESIISFFNKKIYLSYENYKDTKELIFSYENDDLAEVLVDFINDLIYYAEKGIFVKKLTYLKILQNKVIIKVNSTIVKNFELKIDLKAATYHNLKEIKIDNAYKNINLTVIFDI